jgi:hypothetical protein
MIQYLQSLSMLILLEGVATSRLVCYQPSL